MAPARLGPLAALGLQVLQRDWLSANHTVFPACGAAPSTVVDTGHVRHAPMMQALVDHALAGAPLQRIVNTHLHSDHCGGNASLQKRSDEAGTPVRTLVPAGLHNAVVDWNPDALSYQPTGQQCPRFRVDGALREGDVLWLGPAPWQALAAPGHDPDAVMLFEPETRTLLAGDALWEDRLAIIFPELEDRPGFAATRATLDRIESLAPRWVIPGHGAPFEDLEAALAASRTRLNAFERQPLRHTRHAARALTMFHMMEVQRLHHRALLEWLDVTPLFRQMARQLGAAEPAAWARDLVAGLLDDGLLVRDSTMHLVLPEAPPV